MQPTEPSFAYIDHVAFLADVDAVAGAVEAGGWRPDLLVGIGRGGLVPAVYLSHATGIAMLSVDYSAGVADFGEALLARLARRAADGERLLIVDDINDSGRTIDRLRAALGGYGADLGNVRFAVLIDNVRSTAAVDYRSRSIDRVVDKHWFVFPWEGAAPHAALVDDAQAVPERLA
jgi:hypoxanthine phosphoribosyltransferase